ncbi:CIC11C00000003996 [Sungouiella intermedia]|uniref:CIC11C00000003996 n=1 Tax=Sungouiella intermedia TaxID=45354 RepID=A0A1L0CV40_9ASCO|nr:CIC11C00000003996 [[Candida] intermedia]
MAPAPAPASAPIEENIDNVIRKLTTLKPLSFGKRANSKVIDGPQKEWIDKIPKTTRDRLEKAGIDISQGYPAFPPANEIPRFLDEAYAIRNKEFPYEERALKADKEKKALLGAAKEVRDLTKHIGTEIVGLQLKDLTEQQKDELALLVAERVVVFFRDQDLSPQEQLSLGEYWGQIERHPQASFVPLPEREAEEFAKGSGISVIWRRFLNSHFGVDDSFKNRGITSLWHTDLVHEKQPAGLTHLHLDAIPPVGGDTAWSSGYAAYDKLSPALQKFLDGKTAIYRSAHAYLDRENPLKGPVYVEREHPIVRTHPATGWKSLFVNRAMTVRIVGLQEGESKLILDYLFDVFEKNLDIQVRWTWQPTKEGLGTSAIWDNRVSQHNAINDYDFVDDYRHGTRVTALAEIPFFDPESKSQREALGLSLD